MDGPGFRFVVFTQGCPHHCEGCHNPESHDPSGGYDCEIDKIVSEVEKNPLLSGVTFSGGEPFCQVKPLIELAQKVIHLGKNLIIYTGYQMETLLKMGETQPEILELIGLADMIVDGPFILQQRDLNLLFRGSLNQRVIDAKQTLKQKKIVETTFAQ